jgi:DNA-binding CsgD family transcriptional regulator
MYRFSNDINSDAHQVRRRSAAADTPASADDPAVMLLDAHRRLVMASPSARAMLDAGTTIALLCGTLAAGDPSCAVGLGAAFHAVASGYEAARTVRLGGNGSEVELQLIGLRGDDCAPRVIATIRRVKNDQARLNSVARRFGLTPAESNLLAALCGGASLIEASAHLGVARTTARTHLQRIFDKSGTHRQAELVRMVLA